ncbi:MAG: methyltransferase domain-containing protein [Desulfomonilia bacterium]
MGQARPDKAGEQCRSSPHGRGQARPRHGGARFRLRPFVRSVTCVDSSRGMLEVLKKKVEGSGLKNVRIEHLNLDAGDKLKGCYDLITSSMTLHHIAEIGPLLKLFFPVTNAGGYLCIADLDLGGGRFHTSNEGVFHDGIDRETLRRLFVDGLSIQG